MGTMGEARRKKGKAGPPLLHGSDVPNKVTSFNVICKELREAPEGFNNYAIMDFSKPSYKNKNGEETTGFSLNITNMKQLASRLGFDLDEFDTLELDELAAKAKGKKLTINVTSKNNPTTKEMVRALDIA